MYSEIFGYFFIVSYSYVQCQYTGNSRNSAYIEWLKSFILFTAIPEQIREDDDNIGIGREKAISDKMEPYR